MTPVSTVCQGLVKSKRCTNLVRLDTHAKRCRWEQGTRMLCGVCARTPARAN